MSYIVHFTVSVFFLPFPLRHILCDQLCNEAGSKKEEIPRASPEVQGMICNGYAQPRNIVLGSEVNRKKPLASESSE